MNAPDDAPMTVTGASPGTVNAPGAMLREARERAGLSQDDIAGKLKLAPRQIAAIEIGDWNSLPERTFTRGFMRSYARIVGLDPNIVGLDRSPSQPNVGSQLKPTPEAIGEVTMEHDRGRTAATRWAVPALLIAVLAAGVAYYKWGELVGLSALKVGTPAAPVSDSTASTAAPGSATTAAVRTTPATATTDAVVTSPLSSGSVIAPATTAEAKDAAAAPTLLLPPIGSAATAAPTLAPSPSVLIASPGEKRISITFRGKSWTEVRSKSDLIYSEASLPGTKEFNGKPPLSFIVGNASNVSLSIDGKPYDMTSITRNDVARFRIE